MDATFTRRNTTIDIPLLESGSGAPLVARSVGHPNLELTTNGRIDPRSSDQWSVLENYQITGRFVDPATAYDDAIALCDIVKSGQGTPGTLNIPKDEYDDDIDVVPLAEQEQALKITYAPGRRNWVEVGLGLTRVGATNGSGVGYSTPTADGDGPIRIKGPNNSVVLKTDIEVERSVGRPNSTVRRNQGQHPRYIEKRKSAYDAFSLTLEAVENVTTKTNDLIDMFSTRLRRDDLQLDFNGTFGLGEFDVVPQGSNAIRQVEPAAQKDVELVPQLNLRVVDNS